MQTGPTKDSTQVPGATVPAPAERPEPRRILVVDDSAVTRLFASRLLAARGHAVELARTVEEALTALRERPFDLVLIDLHMPRVDGVEAVEVLEREVRTSPRPPPPRLIVMTANPEQVDERGTAAAAFDGVLPKPLTLDLLVQTVEGERADAAASAPAAHPPVLDWDAAAARLGGRYEMLPRLAELLREECVELLTKLEDAMQHRDADLVRRSAHTLKGSAGVFVAAPTVDAAQRLESLAKTDNWTDIADAWRVLADKVRALLAELGRRIET